MPDEKLSPKRGNDERGRRNHPPWMASKKDAGHEEDNKRMKSKKVQDHNRANNSNTLSEENARDEVAQRLLQRGHGNSSETSGLMENSVEKTDLQSRMGTMQFSKLLEGVVFALSGFVNPERGLLRSHAMEMGAEYRSDWSPDCTLLVCAFPNTPKFKQVVTDCGTIVSKEWISECYKQKKLVEIDCFLMHAGKPWRKLKNSSLQVSPDQENALCGKRPKAVHGVPPPSSSGSSVFKEKASESHKLPFSSSKVQEWASLDFNSTISWLQSQEEKPEPRELKRIAAEGILTCLEDAIDALKDKTDVARVIERWSSVPLVVKELAKLESKKIGTNALSREEILEQAVVCKSIYEKELHHLEMLPMSDEKHEDDDEKTELMTDDGGADSDETIEMPEDEVDQALKDIVSRQ